MNEIPLSPKPSETVLPETDSSLLAQLHESVANVDHSTIEKLTSENPRELYCWAALAATAGDGIDGYAFARVGYHRGLDALRANGWRGSGYVRAKEVSNRGFLTCLALLHYQASLIGEEDEKVRCFEFLQQLDPTYDWNTFPFKNPIDFMFEA